MPGRHRLLLLPLLLSLLGGASPAIAADVGFNPDDTPEGISQRFSKFLAYLEQETSEPHTFRITSSYEDLRDQLRSGAISVAVLSPLNYVKAKVAADLEVLAHLEKYNASTYGSVILVKADQVPEELLSLSGRTFVFFDKLSTSGYLYPLAMLRERGITIPDDRRVKIPGTHFDVIRYLAEHDACFGATSTDKLDEARLRHLPVGKLYKVLESPSEIPFDAIVLSRALPAERRSQYRRTVAKLLIAEGDEFRMAFPPDSHVTALASAHDSDYDPVRKAYALVEGAGVIRLGLSLNVEPSIPREKVENFRKLQEILFTTDTIYLDIKLYERDAFDTIIDDLKHDRIDLAELPPIATGRAISEKLTPLLVPMFDTRDTYQGLLIRHIDNVTLKYPEGLKGKRLSVLKRTSASGFAFPVWGLEIQGIGLRDVTLVERTEPYEVIEDVATKRADAGALALYQLRHGMDGGLPEARKVTPLEGSSVEIPNGGYVLNMHYSRDVAAARELKGRLLNAASHLSLRPSFAEFQYKRGTELEALYLRLFPPPSWPLQLLTAAAALIVIATAIFLWWYSPGFGGVGGGGN